jgi:CRP-like cAMP-binding protein
MSLHRSRLDQLAARLLLEVGLSAARSRALGGVLHRFEHRTVSAGERLCTAGDRAESLAVVSSGRVRLEADGLGPGGVTLQAPLVLGALAMVDSGPRLVTCTATDRATLLQLSPRGFQALLEGTGEDAEVFREFLMASMFARLAEGTLHLRSVLGDQPLHSDEIHSR